MSSLAGETVDLDQIVGEAADRFTSEIRRGRRPDIDLFVQHYPDAASTLRQILPALAVLGTDGASVDDDLPSTGGQRLGDFRLLREIGRGGMGVVYEAEQVSLGRRIAVKVLPFAAMLDSQQLARFKNEARAAASLNHPNIVGIHYVGTDRGVHYYAMQFVEGLSLDRVIAGLKAEAATRAPAKSHALEVSAEDTAAGCSLLSTQRLHHRGEFYRTVAQLGVQAAEALHHAHELSIVHRDVKPGNLLLEPSGKLLVTDFGLARIEGHGNLTLSGDLLGTLRYMSPEQALGNHVGVDHRTDVYSLGATLYELIALEQVVAGDDRASILRGLAHNPIPLRAHDPRVPPDLETILLKSLEREAGDRYATARELADDLRRFLGRQSIRARRPTLTRRLANRVRRYPQLTLAIGLACVVVTLTASLAAWSIDRAQQETAFQRAAVKHREQLQREAEEQVREHVYVRSMQRAGHAWQDNNFGPATWALEEHLPRPGEPDLRGFEWHYLSNLCRNAPRPFGNHRGHAYASSFSPDEKLLATAGIDGVRIWAWPSRKEVKHLRDASEDVDGIAWSPDGARLVSFSEDWHLRIYRTKDWSMEASYRFPGPLVGGQFTPDAGTLLIAERKQSVGDGTTEGHNVVHAYDVASWQSRGALMGVTRIIQAMAASSDGRFVAAVADDAVCVWDLSTHELLHRWPQTVSRAIAFAHHSSLLAVGLQGEIRIYDVSNGKLLNTITGYDGAESIAFGVDDSTFVSVGRGRVARVWRRSRNDEWREAHKYVHPQQPLWSVSMDQDGIVVTTDHAGGVWSWDSKVGQDRRRIIASPEYVQRWLDAVASGAKPAGEFAAIAERWSHQDPPPRAGGATSIAWSPNGDEAVVANHQGDLTLWDSELWEPRGQLALAIPFCANLAWSPDGRWIAAGGSDALAIVEREPFRLVTRSLIKNFKTPLLTFSRDGTAIFAAWPIGYGLRSVKAFRVPSLVESPSQVPIAWRSPIDVHATTGDDLSLLLEGRWKSPLAAAVTEIYERRVSNSGFSSNQRTIALIKSTGVEVVHGGALQSRVQIVGAIHSHDPLVLTPNGRTLAILQDTGQVSLWSTMTGQQYFSVNPQITVSSIRISPDGTKLAAVGSGHLGMEEIVVWDATPKPPSDSAMRPRE